MWVLGSNIVIGLYALDMWSMIFVMYVYDLFKYSACNEHTRHVVSVVSSVYGLWDLKYRYHCTYWACGHCCVFRKCVLGSNIAISCT